MMNESNADTTAGGKSEQGIVPTDNDVLCGRGAGTLNHPGNTIYRNFVEEKKIEYLTRNFKREKRQIAEGIVGKIRNLDPPGRFLVHDDDHGEWHDIGDIKARDKTLQALREDAPKVRKKMEEENAALMANFAHQARQMQEDAQRNAQARAIAETEFRERGYSYDFSTKSPSPPSTTTEQMTTSNEHSPAPSYAMHTHEAATGPASFPPYPVHAHAIPPTYVYPYPYPPPGVPPPHPPPSGSMPAENGVCRDEACRFGCQPGYHTPHFCYYGLPHYYMQPPPPPRTVAPMPTRQVEYKQAQKGHPIAKGSKYTYQGN